MKKHYQLTNLLFACIMCLLPGCVAESEFDNSAFETVPPTAGSETSDEETGETYKVKFETSKGDFVIEVHPDWAPLGAARFQELVEKGVFNDARFFRVVSNFMVQFGIPGDPRVAAQWRENSIKDDPVKKSNTRGMVTFATSGKDSRTSQVFINFQDNVTLDPQGFSPFGEVIEGMDVVDALYAGYGEGVDQGRVQFEGNAYLDKEFPELDSIKTATVLTE